MMFDKQSNKPVRLSGIQLNSNSHTNTFQMILRLCMVSMVLLLLTVFCSCGGGGFSSGGGGGKGELHIKVAYPQDNTATSNLSHSFPTASLARTSSSQAVTTARAISVSYYTIDLYDTQPDEDGKYNQVIPTTRIDYPETTATLENVSVGERMLVIYGYDANNQAVLGYKHPITIAAGVNRLENITLDPLVETSGTITGTVIDSLSGTYLAGVLVSAGGVSALTSSDGIYVLSNVPEGEQTVTATLSGYQNYTGTTTVIAGDTVTLDISMTPAPSGTGSVSGTVFRADGTSPCTGALVSIGELSANTDAAGNYTINGVTPGTQTITVSALRYAEYSNTVNVPAGSTIGHDARMKVFATVSAGGWHTVALREDGTVWAWGRNATGQLGIGAADFSDHSHPEQVAGPLGSAFLTNVTAIAAGFESTLAVRDDGSVWAWGSNTEGQLGDGSLAQRNRPVQVLGPGGIGTMTDVMAVAAGNGHSIALKIDGTVWTWGNNAAGQLGNNDFPNDRTSPVQVVNSTLTGNLENIRAIAAGSSHSVALDVYGYVWDWGENGNGQLGNNISVDNYYPVQVVGVGGSGTLNNISAIEAGDSHTVALNNIGRVFAWGLNSDGQLGDNTVLTKYNPVQVLDTGGAGNLVNIMAIGAGRFHTIALQENGDVWAWGDNGSGQLGNNIPGTDRSTPVRTRNTNDTGDLQNISIISAGDYFSIVADNIGDVYAWGSNANGVLGDGANVQRNIPVYSNMNLRD